MRLNDRGRSSGLMLVVILLVIVIVALIFAAQMGAFGMGNSRNGRRPRVRTRWPRPRTPWTP